MAPPPTAITPILEAAMDIFYRYGFKKASMNDIAKAARLSRQGLYLKFSSKEELFRAALEYLVVQLLNEIVGICRRTNLDVEERLTLICEVGYGNRESRAAAAELIELARSSHNDLITRFQYGRIAEIEAVLIESGIDKQWQKARITANQLANQLVWSASGIKESALTSDDFKTRIAVSVALVVRGSVSNVEVQAPNLER